MPSKRPPRSLDAKLARISELREVADDAALHEELRELYATEFAGGPSRGEAL